MDQNPYAAPSVEADTRLAPATSSEPLPWFAVGARKLVVMSVVTMGFYIVYWFERQYRFQKRLRSESTWPLARAIFTIFYAHDLFRRVEGAAARVDVHPPWTSGSMGIIFVVSAVASRIIDKAGDLLAKSSAGPVLTLISFAMVFGLVYPVVQVQGTMNQLLERERPNYERNERFTMWDWVVVGAGGLLLALGIFGILSSEDEEQTRVEGRASYVVHA